MSWAQRDILKQTQKWRPKGLAREPCDDDGDDDGDDDVDDDGGDDGDD